MIIWINGPFGVGKTSVATNLSYNLKNSYIFDPENTGEFIWDNIPKELSYNSDFQDLPLWREFNYQMLKYINQVWQGDIIVPMTLYNPQYYKDIITRLRNYGIDIKHFILQAERNVLLERLSIRGDYANSWPSNQIDKCLHLFETMTDGIKIDTNNLTVEDITDYIIFKLQTC